VREVEEASKTRTDTVRSTRGRRLAQVPAHTFRRNALSGFTHPHTHAQKASCRYDPRGGSLTIAGTAFAHDFWIISDLFTVAADSTVHLSARAGTKFPEGTAVLVARVANARTIGVSGETKIADMAVDNGALIGVDGSRVDGAVQSVLPSYMTMGAAGMSDMGEMGMALPRNSISMTGGEGPFGPIDMGGLFTLIKVRDVILGTKDPGWYDHPEGTVAEEATAQELRRDGISTDR